MYRRLMAWSMAIASVGALAFVIPLAINVRQYQRDIVMVRATQEAREVSSYATAVDSSALRNTLDNLGYDQSPNRVVVWIGELPVAARANETVGPVPADVDTLLSGRGVLRPTETAIDGGRRVLWPSMTADGPVVVAVDVPSSELNRDVLAKWAWLGLVGMAIVLAAGVVAGRFGRFITPPPMPTREPQPVG